MVKPLCPGCRERDARIAELEARLAELERVQRERAYLREEARTERDLRSLTGESTAMKAVRAAIGLVAPTDSTVLILGETGTGKELVARAIHQLSPRRERSWSRSTARHWPQASSPANCSATNRGPSLGRYGGEPAASSWPIREQFSSMKSVS